MNQKDVESRVEEYMAEVEVENEEAREILSEMLRVGFGKCSRCPYRFTCASNFAVNLLKRAEKNITPEGIAEVFGFLAEHGAEVGKMLGITDDDLVDSFLSVVEECDMTEGHPEAKVTLVDRVEVLEKEVEQLKRLLDFSPSRR